ncbi:mycothiol system anti-sigma-R factor [Microcella putealis]|uniref:Mycothiol system anti-sigma-R factor n=1 Tax=Microcella putealis TaxID=337005 RepID=A0A4V2EXG3_9MICO|nr:zf-HC2 domain-containing protein [Microcella putealis]RZS59390.1 mycothiol system anti-sigma-R factor [Microcella putealis]TQM20015.1 mycothiol system anti-sigma-R factor [Microcella putealis]
MTDCGCDKAKAELEEFLHNELSPQQCQDIRDHMANCDDCSAEHLVGLTLTNKVKEACQEKAPDELRSLVLGAISNLDNRP